MQKKPEEIYSVILLGTSGVGKSTIAFYLEHGYPPPRSIRPTIAFGITHIVVNGAVLSLIDVGGQRKFLDMRFHERFVKNADGLVFVMDSSRKDYKADEEWLQHALSLMSPDIPMIVIANKQDLPSALSPEFLEEQILRDGLKNLEYKLFGTVAADPGGIRSGENVEAAFKYLATKMSSKRKIIYQKEQI